MTSANLLNFPENPSGKLNRQEELERAYVSCGVDFDDLIRDAHALTLSEAGSKDPNYKGRAYMATNMNWNVLGLLKDRYGDRIMYDEENRLFFPLAPGTRLYFKKLDNKSRPRNIPTKHVQKLNSYQGELFSVPTTILYAGYQLNDDYVWDEISCFLVEMRNSKTLNWKSNLGDLAAMMARKKVVSLPIVTNPAEELQLRLRQQPGITGQTADGQTE